MKLYIKEGKLPERCLDCAFLKPPYAYDYWVCAAKKFCDYMDIRVLDSAKKDRNCPLEILGSLLRTNTSLDLYLFLVRVFRNPFTFVGLENLNETDFRVSFKYKELYYDITMEYIKENNQWRAMLRLSDFGFMYTKAVRNEIFDGNSLKESWYVLGYVRGCIEAWCKWWYYIHEFVTKVIKDNFEFKYCVIHNDTVFDVGFVYKGHAFSVNVLQCNERWKVTPEDDSELEEGDSTYLDEVGFTYFPESPDFQGVKDYIIKDCERMLL